MSNPRIYIAISTFLPLVGGAEKQALAQGRSLRERGYETTIITLCYDRGWPRHEVIEGVPIIRVAGTLLGGREKLARPLQKLLYLMALLVMGWTLLQHRRRYDILHLYQLGSLVLPTALVCRLTNKPMIIAIRNTGPQRTGRLRDKPSLRPLDATTPELQADRQPWIGGDLEGLEHMGKLVVRFTCFLLHPAHTVVVVLSSRMKDYLAAYSFNFPDVQLIPNGVDITRFHLTADASAKERAQVAICVSKLRYQKGIDVLLQAWRLVHEQFPQAQLILVGDGPLQTQLERMAQALGIAGSVEFTGLQSDIPAQFHRGGLAVLPSLWEGMPNAVLEAMACGLPCVATRVSGSEDIIQHGVNGLLVGPGDYQGMAQALLTLLRDPALAKKYGQAGRATIEKRYSFENIMDSYIELYQRITEKRIIEDTQPSKVYHLPS